MGRNRLPQAVRLLGSEYKRFKRIEKLGEELEELVLAQEHFKHGSNMNHYVPWTTWDELAAKARQLRAQIEGQG